MTTLEQMAVEILKGDLVAARACRDLLGELDDNGAGEYIPPLKRLTCDAGNVRIIAFLKDNYQWSQEEAQDLARQLTGWKDGESTTMTIKGIERIEVYEFPTPARESKYSDPAYDE